MPRSFFNRERYFVYHVKSILFPTRESVNSPYSQKDIATSASSIDKRDWKDQTKPVIRTWESYPRNIVGYTFCSFVQFNGQRTSSFNREINFIEINFVYFKGVHDQLQKHIKLQWLSKLKRLEFEKSLWHSPTGQYKRQTVERSVLLSTCWLIVLLRELFGPSDYSI